MGEHSMSERESERKHKCRYVPDWICELKEVEPQRDCKICLEARKARTEIEVMIKETERIRVIEIEKEPEEGIGDEESDLSDNGESPSE